MSTDSGSGRAVRSRATMAVTMGIIIIFGMMVAFTPGILVVLIGGMLPAMAALVTDRSDYRLAGLTIAAMNLAGCMVYLPQVWDRGNSLAAGVAVLSEPWPWAVMFMAAAGGWALLWIGPLFARFVVAAVIDVERRRLERIQANIVAEWGRGVIDG